MSIQMCQRFSGKARGYMLAYHHRALEKVNAKCKSESDAIELKFFHSITTRKYTKYIVHIVMQTALIALSLRK